ncbi:MAG: GNAT family N-acetyltransferase [Candidatus Muiribacteriota bacterium]
MNNIILLSKKNKKNIYRFLNNFPVSSLYIYKNLIKNEIKNQGNPEDADYYGYFEKNQLKAIAAFFNAGICLISSKVKRNSLFQNIIFQKKPLFILSFKNSLPDDMKKNIIKNEVFMIRRTNKQTHISKPYTSIATMKHLDCLIELKKKFEIDYWNYIPTQTHLEEYRKNLKEKISKNHVIISKKFNIINGFGVIETDSPKINLLGSIFVDKKYRKNGIGKEITRHLINLTVKENKICALSVISENKTALKIYKKENFCPVSNLSLVELPEEATT